MEKTKSFFLIDNLCYIMSNGAILLNITKESDDYGDFTCFNFKFKDNMLRVPYKKLCYADLINNENFVKRLMSFYSEI